MNLSQLQINELIKGIQLTAELPSGAPSNRRFVTVAGYAEENGMAKKLDKRIYPKKSDEVIFWLRDFEISDEYIKNHWDTAESDLINSYFINGIRGIAALEVELVKHIDDFSLLIPDWETENPV